MIEGIYLSYDAIAGIFIAVIIALAGWLIHSFSKLNKKIDELNQRISKTDVENSKRDEQLGFLLGGKYEPFTKKEEKEKWPIIKKK